MNLLHFIENKGELEELKLNLERKEEILIANEDTINNLTKSK